MYFSNTSKYSLWCSNHQNAAVTKNTVCEPLTGGGWQMTHGIGHENFFWESAASAISAVVLGNGVSGGTGAGKTTMLSALLGAVDPAERIVCVEDAAELAAPVRAAAREITTAIGGRVPD